MDLNGRNLHSVPIFNGANFTAWKSSLVSYFIETEIWYLIKPNAVLVAKDRPKSLLKLASAKSFMSRHMAPELQSIILLEDDSQDIAAIFRAFEEKAKGNEYLTQLEINRRLYALKYKGGDIEKYLATFKSICKEKTDAGCPFPDDTAKITHLMLSLNNEYEIVENTLNKDTTFEMVCMKIIGVYKKRKYAENEATSHHSSVLHVEARDRYQAKRPRLEKESGRFPQMMGNSQKTFIECKGSGYIQRNFPKKKHQQHINDRKFQPTTAESKNKKRRRGNGRFGKGWSRRTHGRQQHQCVAMHILEKE